MKKITHIVILAQLVFISCKEIPVETIFAPIGEKRGVFISCEGNFMYGNSSLSFYDKENRQVYNQVFFARNGAPLGDVAQSLAVHGNSLFVVVNNSGKVVVLDPATLEYKGAITGLVSPRYIQFINEEKAYISDLYARRITVFDPVSLEKKGYISVSDGKANSSKHPTETFARVDDWIFVTCWSYDNQVLVIDSETDSLVDSITVPAQPKKIVVDCYGKIWVLTGGSYKGAPGGYEKPGLVRIDPITRTVEQIIRWDSQSDRPGDMRLNPALDTLLIVAGDLYKMAVADRKLPALPAIYAKDRLFFSVGVDPDGGDIYLADAIDYAQNAVVYRFTSSGIPVDTFLVGINPGDFFFN